MYIQTRKPFYPKIGMKIIIFSSEFTISKVESNGLWVANSAKALRKEDMFIEKRYWKSIHTNVDVTKKKFRME